MSSRLRKLNSSQTPKSSLGPSLQSGGSQEPLHNPFNPAASRHTAKRQRVDDRSVQARHNNSLKWVTNQKPKPHNDAIEDEFHFELLSPRKAHPREERSPEIHDLTQDGSQADTLDITSAQSNGKATTAATAQVPEYRTAQPPKAGNRRPRKSRTPMDAHNSSRERLSPGYIPTATTSPDILCRDDPPPANMVSDLSSLPQAGSEKATQIRTKRARRSGKGDDYSEDELANTNPSPWKKSTNFTMLPSQNRPQRGDIQRSRFFPSKPESQPHARHDIQIASAVSGKHMFPQPGQPNCEVVKLQLLKDSAKVDSMTREHHNLAWLEIHLSKVRDVYHAATYCPIVLIRRSITSSTPARLAIRFKSVEDAVQFVSWVPVMTNNVEERPEAELEKMFQATFEAAEKFDNRAVLSPLRSPPTIEGMPRATPDLQFRARSERRPPTEKLKDKMQGHNTNAPTSDERADNVFSMTPYLGPETRRTRRVSPVYQINNLPSYRWTEHNPNWDKDWRMTLEFPAHGKNRESVAKDDVARLDEGEFLNDNLINFYMRFLQAELETKHPETLRKVHFFNTFFFPTIKSGGGNINYRGVEKWTAKIDLFSYKYIVVPINESLHWYLAIIYNAPKLLPKTNAPRDPETIDLEQHSEAGAATTPVKSETEPISPDKDATTAARSEISNGGLSFPPQTPLDKCSAKGNKGAPTGGTQRFSLEEPRIITLDSLGSPHSTTSKALKKYLAEEAKHKKNIELLTLPSGMTAKHIPAQDNHCDCGAFLLGYLEEFLKDPDEAVRRLLQKENVGWNIDASQIRTKVRDLILTLQKDYQAGEESRRAERKKQRRLVRASAALGPSSPREPPAYPSEIPTPRQEATSPSAGAIRSPGVTALERVFSTPAKSKLNPSRKMSNTSPADQDIQFVQPLEDDSSLDSKTPLSGQAFHSARTSPEGASQIPVDLTTEMPTHIAGHDFSRRHEPRFVQPLPSSSPELSPGLRGIKRLRSESSEEVSLVEVPANRPPRTSFIQPRRLTSSQEILPSIEADRPPTGGSHYDGVDHFHPVEI